MSQVQLLLICLLTFGERRVIVFMVQLYYLVIIDRPLQFDRAHFSPSCFIGPSQTT